MKLAIPSYIYPDNTYWPRIVAQKPAVVVLNPSDGPGNERDSNYMRLYLALLAHRITVLGYIATSWADKPLADIREERARYKEHYGPMHGMFLDEASTDERYVTHYQRMCLQREGDTHVLNPGQQCDWGYLSTQAILMTFEGTRENYQAFTPKWTHTNSWHCVHSVPDENAMKEVLEIGRRHNAGYIWVTSDPGTYNTLPTYFEAMRALLE